MGSRFGIIYFNCLGYVYIRCLGYVYVYVYVCTFTVFV